MATTNALKKPRQKVTLRLPADLMEASQEAVRLGLATSPSAFIEDAVRERVREVRHARMRQMAREAMDDPDFVADMRETMSAFRYADAESSPESAA